MIHAAIDAAPLDSEALGFVVANRMAAARAFRVLRDARTLTVESQVEFVVRGPEAGLLASFSHPGPWAVTLEPQVAVIGADGAWLTGDRRRTQALATTAALFAGNPQVAVAVRARTLHLAAWTGTGREFVFEHRGRVLVLRPDAGPAEANGAFARDGAVTLWTAGELTDAAELLAVAEQAAQIRSLAQAYAHDLV
jgi:hypothetical protein